MIYSSNKIVQARYLGSSEVDKRSTSTVISWIIENLKHKCHGNKEERHGLLYLSMTPT